MESVDRSSEKENPEWRWRESPLVRWSTTGDLGGGHPSVTGVGLKPKSGASMKDEKEVQRASVRCPAQAAVTCRPYVSQRALTAADGILRNFSSQGSYVETTHKFEAGAILIVRMVRYAPSSSTAADYQPRSIALAEVKWCRKLSEEMSDRYGMGLRYLD